MRDRMRLEPVPGLDGISLYRAHPGSGLSRFAGDTPPYWAWTWGGGLVLARFIADGPECVAGLRVLDLGTGSGLVAIAAARAGARHVIAADIDPNAVAAAALNAEANGVTLDLVVGDLLDEPLREVDVVVMGDLFYEAAVARTMLPFARRCAGAGITVLIGDPLRPDLPECALVRLAHYDVADFGDGHDAPGRAAAVFTLRR
ncbi:class I SAM-dependent methyltransferase [Pelagibacterium xiamenense]|uniref:class I SAM-dependent methyltransferase n=1 Tax=Pelagibacterium xiamenense TaxID=2901140 RepID=UPI001E3A895F|nr:50S ribosomal protein L11 methyltransferase [Pelagibacterium xiamenense]MCD7059439.1 50S ribosomal protein L11 methyltransferase [Pelagibacterium xiamenense]